MSTIIKIALIASILILTYSSNQQQLQITMQISSQLSRAKVSQRLDSKEEVKSMIQNGQAIQRQVTTKRFLPVQSNKPSSTLIIFLIVGANSFLFLFLYYMSRRYNRRYVKSNYSQKFQNVMEEVTFRGGKSDEQI